MVRVGQKELEAAVNAMALCVVSLTNAQGLKIAHPARRFSPRKWEAVICAMLASANDFPDSVMPDGVVEITYTKGAIDAASLP